MPGQRIYRSAVAVAGERHFETDLPAPLLEKRGKTAYQTRVTLVEEPIELAATPPDVHDEIGVERAQDAAEHVDAEVLDVSALKGRYPSLAHGGTAGDVGLTPAKAVTEGAGDAADAEFTHATSVKRGP